jgi:IS30 family transposase
MWDRWKAGQSFQAIGRALGKDHVVIQLLLARHGGIAPAARRRSRRVLTLAEREDISRGIAGGSSIRQIAKGLQRAVSTVSRELARHGGRAQYRANQADQQAWESALRPKACLLATRNKLQEIVASKLMQDWSPQQISGWLKNRYPQDGSLRVSHETIYRSLFIQARGALKQELVRHLRSQRRIRRSRHASVHGHSQGRIVDAISIRERPAEIEDRAIPGHWEGDLLRGARHSHVATLVERHSRFCMLVQVPGKDTASVVAALSQHVRQLPATLRRSLTWDRGLEMAQHNFQGERQQKTEKARLDGGGRSLARTRLCQNSLLTGKNTGNPAPSAASLGDKSLPRTSLPRKAAFLLRIGIGIEQAMIRECKFPVGEGLVG